MPINNIFLANTIDYGRQVVNQISAAINGLVSGSTTFTGNLHINSPNTTAVALNVMTGSIAGNGANLFGIDANNITINTFRNFQLQNSSITVSAITGINGGGTLALGSSISLNVVAVDSFTNTRTNLAASANSITMAEMVTIPLSQNAAFVNTGILATTVGGTGLTTYASGQVLIGNVQSGKIVANTIWSGGGMIVETGAGFTQFGANLVQGANITFTQIVGGGLGISANSLPAANVTTVGIAKLNDTLTAAGTLTEAGTANAVNALGVILGRQGTIPTAPGRLLGIDVYKTPGVTHEWTKRTNTAYIILTLVGAGGAGAGSPAAAQTGFGLGGWSGSWLEATIPAANISNIMNVVIGWGGNGSNSHGNTGIAFRGGNSSFSNSTAAFRYVANGGAGGLLKVEAFAGALMNSYRLMSPSTPYPSANIPGAGFPRPDFHVLVRGAPPTPYKRWATQGNCSPSVGGSNPPFSYGGQPTPSGTLTTVKPHVPGPGGKNAQQAPTGDSFGGAGGGGGYNEGSSGNCAGGSGANGLCIIYSYSNF